MKLVRYNNLDDYAPVRWGSLFDNFFDNFEEGGSKITKFVPSTDVVENDHAYEIHMAIPGMKKEDFKLDIKDKTLVISGERKWKEEKKEQNYHRVETQYGSFSRSFNLPENVNIEKIAASYNDGILEIELPKDAKKELKTVIKVK